MHLQSVLKDDLNMYYCFTSYVTLQGGGCLFNELFWFSYSSDLHRFNGMVLFF